MEANNLTNTKPILYLGRDRVNGAYYFLGGKDGVGRFLKFQVYPMWVYSNMIGNFLDIGAEVPTEVLAEVMLFINGAVNYELLPAKQGRAETVVRTDLSTGDTRRAPTKSRASSEKHHEVPSSANSASNGKNDEPRKTGGEVKQTQWPFPNFGINDAGRSNVGSAPVEEPTEEQPVSRRRRTPVSSGILDPHRDSSLKSEATTVQTTPLDQPKTLDSENGDPPVKRKRGRPAKLKTLD